ncbi:MAG: AraC family transcriptional regulator [Bacteroidota bacterium]
MLPAFEKIEANPNHSFYVNYLGVNQFPSPLHFHPETEILLVVQGTGTRIVGDSVERFSPGDLVMIGANVPHVWYSDKRIQRSDSMPVSEAIYIQFNKEAFGKTFWELPESKSIDKLIEQSKRGIRLTGQIREDVSALMLKIVNSAGFSRITLLLSILELISLKEEYYFLSGPVVEHGLNQRDSDRLNKVYKYVIENYRQEITLEKAASLASFSSSAFCRYFKTRTHKTFIQFLNEIRIRHACRLLAEEDFSISEICYICGFNNISYFIRQFRVITGFTPLNYRKKYIA